MLAFAILIFGLVIAFCSFAYAVVNMGSAVKLSFDQFQAPRNRGDSFEMPFDLSKLFLHHGGAMIGMALGSVIGVIGTIMVIMNFVQGA